MALEALGVCFKRGMVWGGSIVAVVLYVRQFLNFLYLMGDEIKALYYSGFIDVISNCSITQRLRMKMQKEKLNLILTGIFLGVVIISCKTNFKLKWTKVEAPVYFTAKFETTKGDFEIESRKEWSPMAVNRLYHLLENGYYKDIAIYRVLPDYIAQFGIHNDSTITAAWRNIKVADEPVLKANTKGTICFARGGPESRGTDLFINLNNNSPFLDTISFMNVTGFPVVAQVISGFDVAESFYSGYGAELDNKQDSIFIYGNSYLRKNYTELDYIHKAYITGRK